MRTRLGPVDINDNLSTVSEITAMAGQVAIEEKAVKEVTKEVESEEFQQVDMEVEEKDEGEWISGEGMDDAVNYNAKEMDKFIEDQMLRQSLLPGTPRRTLTSCWIWVSVIQTTAVPPGTPTSKSPKLTGRKYRRPWPRQAPRRRLRS